MSCVDGRLRLGNLGDFFSHIPNGHLGNLPSHLKVHSHVKNELCNAAVNRFEQQLASWNDDASKKETDNQKMSPLVASFMPSQASNPFFRLMESEIPASPCSESAGSESSQTNDHVARRVSFSPRNVARFSKPTQAQCQVLAEACIAPVLQRAAVSNLHMHQIADDKTVEPSRATVAHDRSMKPTMQILPQFVVKSPKDSSSMRNQSASASQSNAGVPKSLSPGLAVSKQQISSYSTTFTAATYGSPQMHSPTPKPRFSSHDGMA
jgi:hypothetical protein